MSKVLMFCPTYQVNGKDQIWPDTLASLKALKEPEGVRVDLVIGRDNPYPGEGHKNTLHQYQVARQMMLDGGYDALLTVEHDMIVPPDALERLWASSAPVVYGVYMLRHGTKVVNVLAKMPAGSNIGSSITGTREMRAAQKRGWCECSGVGFGCTLIRRPVLEVIEFHKNGADGYAPDWGFAVDCQRAGIRQVARFDVQCGHIDEDSGYILWPGEDWMTTVKCKIVTSFVGSVNGRSYPFQAGSEANIPPAEAVEFARAGFLTILDAAPAAVKVLAKPRNTGKAIK